MLRSILMLPDFEIKFKSKRMSKNKFLKFEFSKVDEEPI